MFICFNRLSDQHVLLYVQYIDVYEINGIFEMANTHAYVQYCDIVGYGYKG